jgi:hypothetical protein
MKKLTVLALFVTARDLPKHKQRHQRPAAPAWLSRLVSATR